VELPALRHPSSEGTLGSLSMAYHREAELKELRMSVE